MSAPPPPFPNGRGPSCIPFLTHHIGPPRVPPIRSSDYELILSDPFVYYLTRILGICHALSYGEATSLGGWFHVAAEFDDLSLSDADLLSWASGSGGDLPEGVRLSYDRYRLMLGDICEQLGIPAARRQELADRLVRDVKIGLAFYAGAAQVPVSGLTFRSYLRRPQWRVLARELEIRGHFFAYPGQPPHGPNLEYVAMLDVLLFQEDSRALWIVDYKTTSAVPSVRLSTVQREFQSQHYCAVVKENLPALIAAYSLPSDTVMGGIIHIAIEKPSIRLSRDDRDSRLVDFTPKSGKNKGVTRQEKEYYGEPQLRNYLARVVSWMTGTGDYTHEAPMLAAEPRVNWGVTPCTSVLDERGLFQYHQRLEAINRYRLAEPCPDSFPTNPSNLRGRGGRSSGGEPSPWLLFDSHPVDDWPEIMKRKGFIVQHRNPEIGHGQEEVEEVLEAE